MAKINIRIALKCEGAEETAAKIEAQVNQLFGEMELKQGEEVEIRVSDDFSEGNWRNNDAPQAE